MGAGGFHGRVRDGIGWGLPAIATRLSNPPLGAVCGQGVGGSGAVWCVSPGDDFHAWGWVESFGRLGPVSFARCRVSTSGLST